MAKIRKRHKSKDSKTYKNLRQIIQPREFRIVESQIQIGEPLQEIIIWLKKLENEQKRLDQPSEANNQLMDLLNLLTGTATGLWRARKKLLVPGSNDQPLDDMKRVFRQLDSTYQSLKQSGLEIFDLTDQPYLTGMIEKVIAFEPTAGITKEIIKETIKPTIYFRDQLMQVGEVIVGTIDQTIIQSK